MDGIQDLQGTHCPKRPFPPQFFTQAFPQSAVYGSVASTSHFGLKVDVVLVVTVVVKLVVLVVTVVVKIVLVVGGTVLVC